MTSTGQAARGRAPGTLCASGRSPFPIPGCRFVRVYQLMCTGYRRDALPCASTRACTSAHHGANHLSPHRRMAMLLVWLRWRPLRVGSCMQVLTTAPGDAWPSDGHAPRVAPWGAVGSTRRSLGSATGAGLCVGNFGLNTALPWLCHWGWAVRGPVGSCSCPLPIPRLYPRLWTGVGALRTWRRAVPVWGLEWCRASGDYGRAPLVVGGAWCAAAAASLLPRRRTPLGRGAETPGE